MAVALWPQGAVAATPAVVQFPGDRGDELTRLAAQLALAGPEGRDSRLAAMAQLVAMPSPAAHRVLQDRLRLAEDPDGVCVAILEALQQQLLGLPAAHFGGAEGEVRRQIVVGYLVALSPEWSDVAAAVPERVRRFAAARATLQRFPARELEAAARGLLGSASSGVRIEVLRCLGDLQNTLYAPLVAEQLEGEDESVRRAAVQALQWLVYPDAPIRTRAEFRAWSASYGDWRYLDLAERAARAGLRAHERELAQLAGLRIESARDVVRALVVRTPAVDWAAVAARMLTDEPGVFDACLDLLIQSLAAGLPAEESAGSRQAFCRAVLLRFRQAAQGGRDAARILELAASLARIEDGELATEIVALTLTQLESGDPAVRLPALRSLRRFPAIDTRARLVQIGREWLGREAVVDEDVVALLTTLAARGAVRWVAPAGTDPDHGDWLQLVAACCGKRRSAEVRQAALTLAQTLDGSGNRVAGAFPILRDLVRDAADAPEFRSTCVIHLQGWRNDAALAATWVATMHELLADPVARLRAQAAEALSQLVELVDARRAEWIAATIPLLRTRLAAEPDVLVLRDLAECMQACGREPQMPERAIGALLAVLLDLGNPPPPEQQLRLDPLLQALTTIAADARADTGQWVAACAPLLQHRRRQSLRVVLQAHSAADFAKDAAPPEPSSSPDAAEKMALAQLAQRVLRLVIETALLKNGREAWSSSPDLIREARDVRVAFGALDGIDGALPKDSAQQRLLRLEVDLVAGRPLDVVQRATAWLQGDTSGAGRVPMSEAETSRMRLLMAEANLAAGRPEAANRCLADLPVDAALDAGRLDLEARLARALAPTDLAAAVALFDRVLRATPPDDVSLRARLLDWMQHQLRLAPESRAQVMERGERYAALFTQADCPLDLRETFEQLRSGR
jgi:hypothetical protein